MSPPDPLPTSALLAESAWLHRLALRLVAEPSGAADAAQETLAKALEHPPGAKVPLRRWLSAVLRNVVRQERRTAGRREARERSRPPALEGEPADELAARLELHGKLLIAVRRLSEPYRTTVALRFLEDLTVPAVAERTGVPEKTVYTRLQRALHELRQQLDREHGRREAWVGLLIPTLSPPALPEPAAPSGAPLLTPFLAMGTLWKWTGACAALAAVGFLALRTSFSSEAYGVVVAPADGQAVPLVGPTPSAAGERSVASASDREALAPTAPVAAESAGEPVLVPAPSLIGFVHDLTHGPVSGLEVTFESVSGTPLHPEPSESPPGRAWSDGEGRFELPRPSGACRIVARGGGYAPVVAPTLAGPPPPEPPIVYVAREASYSGHVLDAEGAPIEGAELGVELESSLARELVPGTFAQAFPRGASDGEGHFELPSVGYTPGSLLSASAPGFETTRLELPSESDFALVLVLATKARSGSFLSGRVQHAAGSPANAAWVSVGGNATQTDEEGLFDLTLAAGDTDKRVQAVQTGFLPAEADLGGLGAAERQDLLLVLGSEALSIGGRVLDAAGKPLEGVEVWTDDGVPFGQISKRLGEVDFMLSYDVEAVIGGTDTGARGGRDGTTDVEGRFALTSLLDRRYTLYAMDPHTYELAGPFEFHAGNDSTVIVLAGEPMHAVAGRVLSFSGEPIAGANVRVERTRRGPGGLLRSHRSRSWNSVHTDAEGRFEFAALCIEGTRLAVAPPDAPREATFELSEQGDPEGLELVFPATCHLRVFLDDPERADTLTLQDQDDESLELAFQIGGVMCVCAAVQIEEGVSDLLTTDESARTLVLYKDGKETERIPLHLSPGGVNEVRP